MGQMLSQTQSIQADAKLKSIAHRDAVFSTARRVFALWEEAAGEQHAGPAAQPGTAPIDWARLHVEALGSGALLGAVHVGLALFVGEWQARLPAPRTAWWCEPFYYFAKFLGWQLAGALAALRIAAVLAATAQVRALACLYYHYSACGSGNSSSGGEEGLRGQTHVRDAGAVDDTLKILVFYVGLLLLSPFWYKVSCHFSKSSQASSTPDGKTSGSDVSGVERAAPGCGAIWRPRCHGPPTVLPVRRKIGARMTRRPGGGSPCSRISCSPACRLCLCWACSLRIWI